MRLHSLRRHLPLIVLFALALPIFCWLRWQPQVWFAGQLAENNLAGQITYTGIEKSFPGLAVQHANIHLPDGKQLAFDSILLRPAIISLLSGKSALFFRLERGGLMAQGTLSADSEKIDLNNVEIRIAAEKLALFDSSLQLLGLGGELQLGGDMQLRRSDGMPLNGDIHATWNQAATLLFPALKSGNIRADIASKNIENPTPIWQWNIESEPQSITGKGKLVPNGMHLEDWLLRGNIRLQGSDKADGNVLSGTLGAPRWQ